MEDDLRQYSFEELHDHLQEDFFGDEGGEEDPLYAALEGMSHIQLMDFYRQAVLPDLDTSTMIEEIDGWREGLWENPRKYKKAIQIAQQVKAGGGAGGSKRRRGRAEESKVNEEEYEDESLYTKLDPEDSDNFKNAVLRIYGALHAYGASHEAIFSLLNSMLEAQSEVLQDEDIDDQISRVPESKVNKRVKREKK